MKVWIIRMFLLIGYCIPYAFLAMNGDVASGTAVLWHHAFQATYRKYAFARHIYHSTLGAIGFYICLSYYTKK